MDFAALKDAVLSGSTKRIVGGLVGIAVIALNNKFALGITDAGILAIGSIVTGWVVQSGLAAGKVAAAEASGTIVTKEDAMKELSK